MILRKLRNKTLFVLVFIFSFSLLSCDSIFKHPEKEKMSSISQSQTVDVSKRQGISESQTTKASDATSYSIEITYLFTSLLKESEKDYLKSCRILTYPKLPVDFGISSARDGGFDPILAEYLKQQAFSSGKSPQGISEYAKCMLIYASLVAQSHYNLISELKEIGQYSYDDLLSLAKLSIEKTKREGITDPTLRELIDKAKLGIDRCRFNGSVEKHLCGSLILDLANQTLSIGNTPIWSPKEVLGIKGEYNYSVSSDVAKQRITELNKSISNKRTIDIKKLI